jgi:response regulator RpfG family c-di-GMP phosphodiesterase
MEIGKFTYFLIFAGTLVMILCVLKFRTNVDLSSDPVLKNNKTTLLSGFHHIIMMFIFLGCILVFYTLYQGWQNTSIFFIGFVFFFGAIFAFLQILLNSDMLVSLKDQQHEMVETNRQLHQTQDVTIFALAYLAEMRDIGTKKHLERTAQYVRLLAEELFKLSKYHTYIRPSYIADLTKSVLLHDIGKVAIPDSILKKPGELTPEEFEIVKKHCEYGTQVLKMADEKLSFQSFLKIAIQMVATHHEKWNGTGYPCGLKGDAIPLSGRIMALADVYDALRSDRCYKKGLSHEEACRIIWQEKGKHFDPEIVDVFFGIKDKFHEVFKAMA